MNSFGMQQHSKTGVPVNFLFNSVCNSIQKLAYLVDFLFVCIMKLIFYFPKTVITKNIPRG